MTVEREFIFDCCYCGREGHSGEFKDSYGGVHFICEKCFILHGESWIERKREWASVDTQIFLNEVLHYE